MNAVERGACKFSPPADICAADLQIADIEHMFPATECIRGDVSCFKDIYVWKDGGPEGGCDKEGEFTVS